MFKELFTGQGSFIGDLVKKIEVEKDDAKLFEVKDDFEEALSQFLSDYYSLVEVRLNAYQYCQKDFKCCENKTDISVSELLTSMNQMRLEYAKHKKKLDEEIGATTTSLSTEKEKLTSCETTNPPSCDAVKTRTAELQILLDAQKSYTTHIEALMVNLSKVTELDLLKLKLFSDNLVNDHLQFVTPPIFPQGNKINVKIAVSASDSSLQRKWNIMPMYNDSSEIELFVRHKWFVSFSSGPFLSFGKTLYDDHYSTYQVPNQKGVLNDSLYRIRKVGSSSELYGIAAFVNFGTKFCDWAGFGLSPGVGITLGSRPRPVFLLGPTIYFGNKNHQLTVSAGFATAAVNRIRGELYSESSVYIKPPTFEYNRKLVQGSYFSIGYTIFSLANSRATSSRSKK